MARKKIGALLTEKGHITEFQLVAALSHQRKWKSKLGQSLIELGYLEENQLYEVLAEQLGMEFIDPRKIKVSAEAMKCASKELARDWMSVPVGFDGQTWTVATSDPQKPGLMDKLALCVKGPVKLVLATTLAIESLARKIPDKIPVATVQPVKRAFVRDENGLFTPLGKPAPAAAKPQSDDDLFLEGAVEAKGGSDNIEIPLTEYAPSLPEEKSGPPPAAAVPASPAPEEIISPPAEPQLDTSFMDQAPAPAIPSEPAPEPTPESAAVELPPDELMEIEHEREPDLSEPTASMAELDEIPLEAAHESAANIPVEKTKDSTDMIDLDELLPPPVADQPAPAAEQGLPPALGDEGPPSLMETFLEPAPTFEAPPLEEAAPPEMPGAGPEEAPVEAPPVEMPAEEEPDAFAAPPEMESGALEAPPLEEPAAAEEQELFAPEPEQAGAPPDQEGSIEAPSLPDLGDLKLDATPASDSSAGDVSLDVPSLDSILSGVTGQDAGPLSEEPSAMEPEPTDSVEAPPLEMPSLYEEPGREDQATSAGAGTMGGAEEIETPEEAVTEEVTDEAAPSAPPEAEAAKEEAADDAESSQEIIDKITMLEQQIKGMSNVLTGFKDMLKDKKSKPKGKK
ncbi:MAG TPA: hypothetical protein VM658_00945 [bacterium]|nr:hypothetical protein [bacterium]